jgi:hypothetical protein
MLLNLNQIRSSVAAAMLAFASAGLAVANEDSGSYFLVVDHSGSMLTKVRSGPDSGRSRWEVLRDRASGFVERLPEGSHVWAGVFSARDPQAGESWEGDPYAGWFVPLFGRLDTTDARIAFATRIKAFPEPGLANGTWLNQAMMESLLKAEAAGQNDPDAYLTVMVYTDGIDQGHGRTTAEMIRNKGSICTKDEVDAKILALKARHRNFNLVHVYRPGDESIMDAHVVRLVTNRLQLASPLAAPEQTINLELRFNDDERLKLEGRPLVLSWQPLPDRGIPAIAIEGGPFVMKNGKISAKLRKAGEWPAGQDVRARLKLEYPRFDDALLVEEGGSSVEVLFQGAQAPAIQDLLPADGSHFPVGRPISFSLTTLPGCEVEWNFGDGSQAKGNPAQHSFEAPGAKEVVAKVTDPRTGLSATARTKLTLVELKLTLDPLPTDAVPGGELRFSATAAGSFRSFFWDIGGRTYAGQPRTDGVPGTELRLAFDRPGAVSIRLHGEGSAGGRAEAEEATLVLKEIPAIRLSSPAPGEVLYFGSRREIRAEIEGVDVNQIQFSLESGGEAVIPPTVVDVRREGSLRTAMLPSLIPTLPQRTTARLKVEAVGTTPPLQREIEVRLESEPPSVQIVLPDGREPHVNRQTPVRLETNAKLSNIRWDFGDGWQDGSEIERPIWSRYGTYIIQVSATAPDGSELVAAPVEVEVPVRPANGQASVIYKGRKVGAEVSKVPVNATLELRSETSGDVIATRWLLDGAELSAGQETVTVKERGFKTLQLVVDATPEAGGPSASIATVEFRTSDKILFWVLTAGCLLVLGLFGRLLLGNKWRFAQLLVGREVGGSLSDGGTLQMPWGIRSWWTKRAEIAMTELDRRTCSGWRGDTRVRFEAGKDPKLLPLGDEWQGGRLEPENSRRLPRGSIKRWTFLRKPFIRRNSDRIEYRVGTITLTIPPLKPGILGRWPEFLFVGIAAAFVAGLRMLFEWLY